jgi:hypothetical protein
MLAGIIQSMLPPGFDLEDMLQKAQTAMTTVVATVQRIEQKQDAILNMLQTAQAATVTPPMIESNSHDDKQHFGTGSNTIAPAASPADPASAGHAPASGHASGDGDDRRSGE